MSSKNRQDDSNLEGSLEFQLEDESPTPETKELEVQVNHIRTQGGENPLSSNQIEILKRYIELKETEVRDLRQQQQQYQEFTQKNAIKIDTFIKQNRLLTAQLDEAQRNIARLQAEMEEERREHNEQLTLMKSDFDDKLKQAGATQDQMKELIRRREEFKDKVKEDLKRIKLKERELENKYELLKNDTQTLLESKDKQILELKKKTDALDLELEQFDDRLRDSANILNAVAAKKRRLIDTMKLAISLLEDIDKENMSLAPDSERKAG
ncbi:MAG: hypothetical protein ACKN9V_08270 [Pseudomonadota bacterium]